MGRFIPGEPGTSRATPYSSSRSKTVNERRRPSSTRRPYAVGRRRAVAVCPRGIRSVFAADATSLRPARTTSRALHVECAAAGHSSVNATPERPQRSGARTARSPGVGSISPSAMRSQSAGTTGST